MENNQNNNNNQGSAQRSKSGSGNFRNDPQRAAEAGRKGGLANKQRTTDKW